jgi:asparagine synthase (glutamine-hydrolysing)
MATLNALRRQMGCFRHVSDHYYEKRYPYLDRDLLEFLFAIPRDQLVRPGQRRSLMRRALAGIVPDEVLNRRRKAFVSRAPMEALTCEPIDLALLGHSLRVVDPACLNDCMQAALQGREIPMTTALRTVILERWLRHVVQRGIIQINSPADRGLTAPGWRTAAFRMISTLTSWEK